MKIKKFDVYRLNEDEDENYGPDDDITKFFVPKKVIKWFKNLGVKDYHSAINDLRDKGYIITEYENDSAVGEGD